MDTTPEEIRDCAVRVVEEFVNNKVPLSEGIAKEAQDNEFNPEQIKRVIEASNSIAYLKLLKEATDRTFEFPIAKYAEVMGHVALPKNRLILDVGDPKEPCVPMEESVNKLDLGMFSKQAQEYSTEELELFLMKESIRNRAEIEKLAHRKVEIMLEMEDSLNKLKKGSRGIEKLAEVADETLYGLLAPFFGLEKKAEEGVVFMDKDLNEARRLVGLCHEAISVSNLEIEKLAFDKRAASILGGIASSAKAGTGKVVGGFVKKAPIHGAGYALGAGLAAAPVMAAAATKGVAKHVGGWGVFNTVTSVAGASSYKPKNEDVWRALHG